MVEENLKNEVAVTTVLNQQGQEPLVVPPKKHRTRKSRKKAHKKDLPVPQIAEPNSIWVSVISNLVLLIAIFTIVFAAHKAIQSKRQQVQPPVTAETQVTETPSSEPAPLVSETPKEETIPLAKKHKKARDPYTSGGPRDLDLITDSKNPWNGGGVMDLDNDAARSEYKKHYLSANESDK